MVNLLLAFILLGSYFFGVYYVYIFINLFVFLYVSLLYFPFFLFILTKPSGMLVWTYCNWSFM